MTTWQDYIVSGSISKTIEDAVWSAQLNVDLPDISLMYGLEAFVDKFSILRDDHNDTSRRVFYGFFTNLDLQYQSVAQEMTLPLVDHGWYLSRQTVQPEVISSYLDSDPALIIEQLLGGTNSGNITGIGFFNLILNPDWSSIQKTFQWTTKTTKWQAIQEMCTYTDYVFHVFWSAESEGSLYAKAYFVKKTEIDDGFMGLPAAVIITSPDDQLISANYIFNRAEVFNQIDCTGYNQSTNEYFTYVTYSTEVGAGEECPVTYFYQDLSGLLDSMAKTQVKSQSLFDDLYSHPKIYVARFKRRYDLQLYQKINFSGYAGIVTDDMRITAIKYNFGPFDDTVEIQCSPIDSLLISDSKLVKRSMDTNIISEEGMIVSDQIRQLPEVSVATITDVSGNLLEVNFDRETNKTVWVRQL